MCSAVEAQVSVSVLTWVGAHPSAALNVLAVVLLVLAAWLLFATQLRQRRLVQASGIAAAAVRVNGVFYAVAGFAVLMSLILSSYSTSL